MAIDLKRYTYHHGKDAALDDAFSSAAVYGKVKLSRDVIFWKVVFRWLYFPLNKVQRIFRRVEQVTGKMCCGTASFDMEKLVLVADGEELELYIGDNMKAKAQELLQALKDTHPELQYGKE